jgi:hypothetical protein
MLPHSVIFRFLVIGVAEGQAHSASVLAVSELLLGTLIFQIEIAGVFVIIHGKTLQSSAGLRARGFDDW